METNMDIIKVRNLTTRFGKDIIHDKLNLDVHKGEILGIVGGSGSGKTVLLNTIIGLNKPVSGDIYIFDHNIKDHRQGEQIKARWGVLYQQGALFSSLSVAENIEIPMKEIAHIPNKLADELVMLKLQMVGLDASTATKFPSELSGGMIKRVSLARALAIDAELLFLDEPTAGLDPLAAASFDNLILSLQNSLNLTVVMITHDLDTINTICDRVAVLIDKKVVIGTLDEIRNNPHPWIQAYFHGERGRAALAGKNGNKS
jgi:phospholipid/cholesterol/gamma-HCH transport system ATP-binding protein